jgi:FMN phosphatase YigB (HAD superfamily)
VVNLSVVAVTDYSAIQVIIEVSTGKAGRRVVQDIEVILFDIGGVLTSDPWQTLVLTPEVGLAARLGIASEDAARAGDVLWERYSLEPAPEGHYWRDFGGIVGQEIPLDLVQHLEHTIIRVNPGARNALALAAKSAARWGVISDNTAFWYRLQLSLLGSPTPDSDLTFVSFARGISKKTLGQGLFERAAEATRPSSTLVIDDRNENLERAKSVGFIARRYTLDVDESGTGLEDLLANDLG